MGLRLYPLEKQHEIDYLAIAEERSTRRRAGDTAGARHPDIVWPGTCRYDEVIR